MAVVCMSWPARTARHRRNRDRITPSPTATTISPEATPSHGYRRSGTMNSEAASVIAPSANTDAVCVAVTVARERERVARRGPRAGEVAGDHRLAVPRRQRVQRPQPNAVASRTRISRPCGVPGGQGLGEPVGARAAAGRNRARRAPRRSQSRG